FEGGIENTEFGQDLFDADYRLKQIGMGLLPSGVPGLKTDWDLGMERAKEAPGGSYKISSRFWFYPVLPSVSVREDVVAIKGLKVGVFTEVLSAEIDGKKIEDLSTFQDKAGDRFAKAVSENFDGFARVHPSFSRLQGLDEMVALTRAMEEIEERPDLDWWLMEYQVNQVDTREELMVLKRREEYRVPVSGGYYEGYWEVSGGVELMAIALRLKAGDVTALREAVLKTRPIGNPLSWTFSVDDWGITGPIQEADMNTAAELYAHGEFLFRQKKYDLAIAYWRRIVQIMPDIGEIYYRIGQAFERKGLVSAAADYYNKAIALDPFLKNLRKLGSP
ncbi:MAG: tetratricopeptide repeat protein, partial [Candidatus Omnitrophica bacterium]|nr:tetratricopeptide repeat protein [Candidatus Omnitrophota bacterium]